MKNWFTFYFCFFYILFVFTNNVQAQIFSSKNVQKASDTIKNNGKKIDDKISIHFFVVNDSTKKKLDTSIAILHQNPILNNWQIDLGNFATAQNALLFKPTMNASVSMGLSSIQPYLYTKENAYYYLTTRPFTNVEYRIGSKFEQFLKITHTQNVTPRFNIAFSYQKIGSNGFYKYQRINHDNASATINYQSKNSRYNILSNVNYNKLQQDENGGILSDSLLKINNLQTNIYPVNISTIYSSTDKNRSDVRNYYRNASLFFQHQYFIGKYKNELIDSIETKKIFKPILGIKHQLYSYFDVYRYKDLSPDSVYYDMYQSISFAKRDSLFANNYLNSVGNLFSLNGNIYWKEQVLKAEAGIGFEIETPHGYQYDHTFLNNYFLAKIEKNKNSQNEFAYQVKLQQYYSGYALGNLHFQALVNKKISNKIGMLQAMFYQNIQSAPYLIKQYSSNYFSYQHNLAKQSITQLNVDYTNTIIKTSFQFNYFMLGNYIYRDSNWKVQQYNKIIPVTQLLVHKNFYFKHIVFTNQLLFQLVSNNSPIHLPILASRHRISYENFILKNKLQAAIGLEVKYNSPFYNDVYSPLFYSFATQYNHKIKNPPQLNAFFNFKIKRFRGFVSASELQQIIYPNNMNYYLYPAQSVQFRFGVNWSFIN